MKNTISVSVADIDEALLKRLTQQKVGVELSYFAYPWNLEKDTLQSDIQERKSLLADFDGVKSMHGAFYELNPVARDPKIVDVCEYRIMQSIEIAHKIGVDKIVFHCNYFPSTKVGYLNYWIEKQIEFWNKLIESSLDDDMTIYLENTREEDYTYIGQILDAINRRNVMTCYDTGHSHCFTNAKHKPVDWVKGYQNHLGYIHLHSNNGLTDQHIAFTQGSVDFTGFFEEVTQLESKPLIIIEVKSKSDYLVSLNALRELGF